MLELRPLMASPLNIAPGYVARTPDAFTAACPLYRRALERGGPTPGLQVGRRRSQPILRLCSVIAAAAWALSTWFMLTH
jgi:hypothetical protein